MLPLIDLLNHSFEPNTMLRNDEGGSFFMKAERDINKGEEANVDDSLGEESDDV